MADAERKLSNGKSRIDFQTDPAQYRHWKIEIDGEVATLLMDVDEKGALFEGYELKLNSYDLGVDIELADAIAAAALRASRGEGRSSCARARTAVFCAGANIRMLAGATHAHKVNFCKFTNETRNGIEDAQRSLRPALSSASINGTAAGGGYELALAADEIMLVDDGSSAVSLPEMPLLAVLPGTGGLTRVIDKRKVRRDLADVFCTTEEGIKGKRAVEWRLVDEMVPRSKLERDGGGAREGIRREVRPPGGCQGHRARRRSSASAQDDGVELRTSTVELERGDAACDHHRARARTRRRPASADAMRELGAEFWPLRACRELDDAILASALQRARHRRRWCSRRAGDPAQVLAYDALPRRQQGPLARARDPALLEARAQAHRSHLALARGPDRARHRASPARWPSWCSPPTAPTCSIGGREGDNRPAAALALDDVQFRRLPDVRTGCRGSPAAFSASPADLDSARGQDRRHDRRRDGASSWASSPSRSTTSTGRTRSACSWRNARASRPTRSPAWRPTCASPGPETMETKIFARLTAWQNWIFQRPNAVGEEGALKRYGTGQKPAFDTTRV